VGVSQTLRRWTEGATYIWQGGHHVGHWPTFLVSHYLTILFISSGCSLTIVISWHPTFFFHQALTSIVRIQNVVCSSVTANVLVIHRLEFSCYQHHWTLLFTWHSTHSLSSQPLFYAGLPLFWKPGNVGEFCKGQGKGTKSGTGQGICVVRDIWLADR